MLGSDRDDRGVGFAFGLERLKQVRDAQSARIGYASTTIVVVPASADHKPDAVRLATYLRANGARILLETERTLEQAMILAGDLHNGFVVAVAGTLTLYDAAGDATEIERRALVRLARDMAQGPLNDFEDNTTIDPIRARRALRRGTFTKAWSRS